MTERALERQSDDGIMTLVLGALRKRRGDGHGEVAEPNRYALFLELLCLFDAIPDGKPLRTFPGIAWRNW